LTSSHVRIQEITLIKMYYYTKTGTRNCWQLAFFGGLLQSFLLSKVFAMAGFRFTVLHRPSKLFSMGKPLPYQGRFGRDLCHGGLLSREASVRGLLSGEDLCPTTRPRTYEDHSQIGHKTFNVHTSNCREGSCRDCRWQPHRVSLVG